MLRIVKITAFLIITVISLNKVFAADIPIIVIAPGKTTQSYSTVGSAISVIDNDDIEDSEYFFLTDVLNNNSTGINLFQMGGHGTNAGIQLRGLPKRYSTVYIDGIKMSDPSSSDNSFYSENIMKNSIGRVEILRGAQSSLYGSSVDEAMVRVPRHAIVSSINYGVNNKFKNSLLIKYIGETRDYGNVNNGWVDQILHDYATFDAASTYRIWDAYDLSFSIQNMFDQNYEHAWQYSTMGRSLNFNIKRVY